MARYHPDPARIPLEQFFVLCLSGERPEGSNRIPDDGKDRLKQLKTSGIGNLEDLVRSLQTTEVLEELAQRSGLPSGYLRALRNQAERCFTEPFPLSRFPGIPFEYTEALRSGGISDTRDYYEMAYSPTSRDELALRTGIPRERLKELWELCDLSRIPGMGGVPARVAWEAGIRSMELYADTEKGASSTGDLSPADIGFGIRYARMVITLDPDNEADP